jgi:hypothetical protein
MNELRKAAKEVVLAWSWDASEPRNKAVREAMERLNQALAQQDKMRVEGSGSLTTKPYPDRYRSEQEFKRSIAQQKQEPVAWVYNGILHEFDPSEFATSEVTPLYTAPPHHASDVNKRAWVGLTDEEIAKADCVAMDYVGAGDYGLVEETIVDFAKAIEAKLKEKNGG